MKKLFFLLILSTLVWTSCTNDWKNYYEGKGDPNEAVSPLTLKEFFESADGKEYSDFYNTLKSTGWAEELGRNQFITVWAVKNENFDPLYLNTTDTSLVGYHLTYLSYGKTELKNGLRIPGLNKVYLSISSRGEDFYVNGVKILNSTRFKNGVVNEISELLLPLASMYDYIQNLGDDYSIIRDSILYYSKNVFDKANSRPIGVDGSGNQIYDSVFYVTNPMFDNADIYSGYKQYTMFIPSNKVIESCFGDLESQYQMMGKQFALEDTLLAINWIKQAIFHDGILTSYPEESTDLKSCFGKVWRTDVQKIDADYPVWVSNGIVYDITKIKIPNNVIITRIKALVHNFEYLTPDEQAEYYTFTGATSYDIFKGDATPDGATYFGVPVTFYWCMQAKGDVNDDGEFSVEFFPIDYNPLTGEATLMKVPPGEYRFYMGFRSKGHPYVDIYFHSGDQPILPDAEPLNTEVKVSDSSPWNYDRVTNTDPKISKWDGLGGQVGTVIVEGPEMNTFKVKVKYNRPETVGGSKVLQIYHWALAPTENNY